MSTAAFIQRSLAFAHGALADARNGTDEQLHFVPPGGSHSIAWCLWHTARIEDLIINARIQGQPMIWDEEWAARTGLPFDGFGTGQSDDEAQQVQFPITMLAIYLTVWWTVLFAVLPIGMAQEDQSPPTDGSQWGAPKTPNLKKKFITTTWVSAIVWVVIMVLIFTGWLPLPKLGGPAA